MSRSDDVAAFQRIVTVALCGLLTLAVVSVLYLARDLVLPIFVAAFFALVLQGIVRRLCRLGLNRSAAAIVTMGLVLLALSTAIYRLTEPAIEWADRLPVMVYRIEARLAELRSSLAAAEEATAQIEELADGSDDETQEVVLADAGITGQLFDSLGSLAGQGGTAIGLLFFLLAFGDPTSQRIIEAFETRTARRKLRETVQEIERRCAEYLRTVTIINAGVGIATWLALWALGVPSASLWGALAACANFMPYLGPAAMMVILGAVSVATFDEPLAMAAPLLAYVTITTIEGQFITPAWLGRQLTLNPIAVFLAIVVWFWIWGVAGAIIAVPLLASTKIVADQIPALRPLAAFLGRPEGDSRPTSTDGEASTA